MGGRENVLVRQKVLMRGVFSHAVISFTLLPLSFQPAARAFSLNSPLFFSTPVSSFILHLLYFSVAVEELAKYQLNHAKGLSCWRKSVQFDSSTLT